MEVNTIIEAFVGFRFASVAITNEIRISEFYLMCSLRFKNNLLTIEGLRLLRFDMEVNTIIEAFVGFRFASVAITNEIRISEFECNTQLAIFL
jgi:hypothetical protein